MKRKFLILTLCFTLIFSSISYKKSYAAGGVISLPILATVSSLAVASGVVIKGNDDLYDIGLAFYNYVKDHNELTWDIIETTFSTGVVLLNNKLVSVDSNFLDIVKGFFDNLFSSSSSDIVISGKHIFPNYVPIVAGDYKLFKLVLRSNYYYLQILLNNGSYYELPNWRLYYKDSYIGIGFAPVEGYPDKLKVCYFNKDGSSSYNQWSAPGHVLFDGGIVSIPYQGGYSWDNVESKKDNDSISLPIPGNLGQLVGQGSTDFWDNTDNLVGTGGISIPSVDNPSISVDNTDSFPKVEDVPDVDVPDVDVPGTDTIIPSFPNFGDSLDFSPMYLTNVTEKFPFSLPWDIGRLIQKFDVDPVAPIFDVPILSETITLDLTEFDELASIVRFFVLIGFILSLIFISTRLLG